MLLKFTRIYYKYKCRHWIIVDLFNRSNFLQTRGTHLKFTDIKNLLENLSRTPHLHFEVICLCIITCYLHIWIINPLKGDDHASLLPNFNSKIDNPLQEYFDNFIFTVKVWKKNRYIVPKKNLSQNLVLFDYKISLPFIGLIGNY